MTPPDTLIFDTVAERLSGRSHARALGDLALTTLSFAVPPVDRPYRTLRTNYFAEPIPMQPLVNDQVDTIRQTLPDAVTQISPLSPRQLTNFVGTMFQFSDRAPVSYAMTTPYANISPIYEQTIKKADQDGPVSYSDQLQIALNETPHIPSALWNLLITSRQYARWRDTKIIDEFPHMTRPQALEQMLRWEHSVAAAKSAETTSGYQDTSGDAYYVWTHALAKVIYRALPETASLLSRSYESIFSRGSHVMSASRKLGIISVFGTMSNHVPASQYGNAIGDAIATHLLENRAAQNQ